VVAAVVVNRIQSGGGGGDGHLQKLLFHFLVTALHGAVAVLGRAVVDKCRRLRRRILERM